MRPDYLEVYILPKQTRNKIPFASSAVIIILIPISLSTMDMNRIPGALSVQNATDANALTLSLARYR